MEIETAISFRGIGYIGHKVDVAGFQLSQAVFPLTGHIGDLPVLPVCDGSKNINENTGRDTTCIGKNFWFILIQTNADIGCPYITDKDENNEREVIA